MKKVMTIVAVLMFVLVGRAAYAGQFGPPEPAAKEGKVSLGIGGGPVIYWAKHKVNWTLTTGGVSYPYSTTYKEKNNLGGFAGLRLPLGKSLNLEVEGQLKSRFSFGGALTYAF